MPARETNITCIAQVTFSLLEGQQRIDFSCSTANYMNRPFPLGPLLANAFMCRIEESPDREGKMPSYYRRYVHDTLTIMLPFLGTQLLNKSTYVETKVCVKPTNTDLLLHYKSHVDVQYKRGLLKTMLDHAFRLFFNWAYFSEECDRLKLLFSGVKYLDKLINSIITRFIAIKAAEQPAPSPTDINGPEPVRAVLPFIDQASANILRTQLRDLSQKINTITQSVVVSQKIERGLKLREFKPPVVNQQYLVCYFECELCDAGYVGFTRRQLHQRVHEHKNVSSSLNVQFDSIRAKVFN